MSKTVISNGNLISAQRSKVLLEEEGYQMLFASDSSDVLPLTKRHQPWLIVFPETDYSPEWRNYLTQPQRPKVILLETHRREPSFGMRGLPLGVSLYLPMLLNPQELRIFARGLRSEWEQEQASTSA